jgi:hypothetical protein
MLNTKTRPYTHTRTRAHACTCTCTGEDIRKLENGVHVVSGTPGRVFDMIKRKTLRTRHIKTLILDEADEMLAKNFKDQIYDIYRYLPPECQVGVSHACTDPHVHSHPLTPTPNHPPTHTYTHTYTHSPTDPHVHSHPLTPTSTCPPTYTYTHTHSHLHPPHIHPPLRPSLRPPTRTPIPLRPPQRTLTDACAHPSWCLSGCR